jgi:hypothetical protein
VPDLADIEGMAARAFRFDTQHACTIGTREKERERASSLCALKK